MRTNPVKAALEEGKTVFGSEVSRLRSPEIPRIYAAAGLDFVFIDLEHSPFGLETVADMILAARAADIVPLVRVPQAEYAWVARVLDLGAQGVIVPRVEDAQQVKDIVSWTRHPPYGIRGFACTPPQTDHRSVSVEGFLAAFLRETLCIIQIERARAVENLDEMLAIPGVDVACLGYMDLSIDLGIPGQVEHPAMVAAIKRLVRVSAAHGVVSGIICPRLDVVAYWMEAGMRFVSYSTEALLLEEAATKAVRRLRRLEQGLKPKGGARAHAAG